MDRRDLLIATSTAGIAATISSPTQAQGAGSFSYSPAITESIKISIPGKRKIKVAFAINPGVQVIDLAGPWEVFQDVMLKQSQYEMDTGQAFELYTVADNTSPVSASGGLQIIPNYSVINAPQPDFIIIPHFATRETTVIHQWIKTAHENAELTASICTGAFQLAKTGLLDGKEATTNQQFTKRFAESYPAIKVHAGPRFVETGKLATAGGLTAGIDLALRIVDRVFGRKVAQQTADDLEYISTGWQV